MGRYLLAAGIAAATLIPTYALAQQTCEQRRDTRAVGAVAGSPAVSSGTDGAADSVAS